VLAALLAPGSGGILGERFTANKKLDVISFRAQYQPQTDRALFVLHATGAKRDIGQIEDEIVAELENLKARFATDGENLAMLLEGAKSIALGEERFQRETVEGEAKYLAYLDMINAPDGYAEKYAERVRAVSIKDLSRLLEKYVTPTRRGVAMVGLSTVRSAGGVAPGPDPEAVK
jgi:predicted Zn-dependent peptidase